MDAIAQALLDKATAVEGLFSEGKPEYDEAYGIGTWPQAVLTEVETHEAGEYGYQLGLKVNLKGDSMPYTARLNLPRTLQANGHEVEAWMTKKEDAKRDVLNRALAAVGFNRIITVNIDTDEQYGAIADVFNAHVGEVLPLKVTADGKNVFVEDANGKATNREGVKGTWTFEPNGYTKADFLRRKKGK